MTKDTTTKIKGIAILIMILHHFLGYGFGCELTTIWIEIGRVCKICVGIYATLSGYGYYFASEKTIKYGLRKSWGLLQEYWISLFIIFIPCALNKGWIPTWKNIIINLFALGPNLNWNAWYVYFFIFCMVTMPIIYKIFCFEPIVNIGLAIGIPYMCVIAIHVLKPDYATSTLLQVLFNCMLYFGIFLIGYLIAKYDWIEKYKMPWELGIGLILLVMLLRVLIQHKNVFGFNIDIIFAPLFVLGAANFFDEIKTKWTQIFFVFGKYSTGMWFIHAIFFATYVKEYFQPIMTIIKFPPLMFVWLVVMSLTLAVAFKKVLNAINRLTKNTRRGI